MARLTRNGQEIAIKRQVRGMALDTGSSSASSQAPWVTVWGRRTWVRVSPTPPFGVCSKTRPKILVAM